jgi:hypothetical protein
VTKIPHSFTNRPKQDFRKNSIKEIHLEDGMHLSDFIAIKEVVHSHFESLYTDEEEAIQIPS